MINPYRAQSKVNPQREKGHREIANDCYRALIRAHLPGAVYQVVLSVIDKTWGFNQLEARVAISELQEATGLSHYSAVNAVRTAEELRLIVVEKHSGGRSANVYMFNKHFDTWLPISQTKRGKSNHRGQSNLPSKSNLAVNQTDPLGVNQTDPHQSIKLTLSSQSNLPSTDTPKETIKETIKEKKESAKNSTPYGEFKNVILTDDEKAKLLERFGYNGTQERIETLSAGIASKGYKYKSHYAAILSWERRDKRKPDQNKKTGGGNHEDDPDAFTTGRLGHVVMSTAADLEDRKLLLEERKRYLEQERKGRVK